MHTHDRATLPPISTVLTFGAGTVGLLCAAMSKVCKAKKVIIADIQEDRVNLLCKMPLLTPQSWYLKSGPETIEATLEFAREVTEMVKGVQLDGQPVGEVNAVFECTGLWSLVCTPRYMQVWRIESILTKTGLTNVDQATAGSC